MSPIADILAGRSVLSSRRCDWQLDLQARGLRYAPGQATPCGEYYPTVVVLAFRFQLQ